MRFTFCLFLSIVLAGTALAQDIHFSRYDFSPLNTNPAATGLYDGDFRAGVLHRQQWRAVPVPYTSTTFFADLRPFRKKLKGDCLGIGVLFNQDTAGDSKYTTTQFYVPLSYIKTIDGDSTLLVSLGITPGLSSTGFKTNDLTFDSQYNGYNFDPSLASMEQFPLLNFSRFDLNVGGMLQYTLKPRAVISAGVSLCHITPQKVSYFNNADIGLDRKLSINATVNYPILPVLDVTLGFLAGVQGKFSEFLGFAGARYYMGDRQALTANLGFRSRDAFILQGGIELKQWRFMLGYDVNTSNFNPATNRRGAIEVGLIYQLKKRIPFIPKKRVCPVSM